MRHLLSAAIVVFFLAMMALLARDHIVPMMQYGDSTTVSGAQLADVWGGTDEWMDISLNGTRIGAMRQVVEKDALGYNAAMKGILRAGFISGELQTAATMNERLELQAVSMRVSLGQGRDVELAGRVQGRDLFLRLKSDRGVKFTRIALREVPTLNVASDALFAGRQMEAGDSYLMDVYDPLWGMQAGKMRVAMVGEESIETESGTIRTRMAEASMPNVRMRAWLDEMEKPVRREISFVPSSRRGSAGSGSAAPPAFTLRMDRIGEAAKRGPQYAELLDLPGPPAHGIEELQGENSGEPLESFGLLQVLLRSQMKNLGGAAGGEAPAQETK